jgi:hypothetical protein
MSRSRVKCAGCGKRIPTSEPDLVLRKDGSEARRFYHERCFVAARRRVLATPDLWFMTHRYIDGRTN